MTEGELRAMQEFFPKMPDEILEGWILHYARNRTWPPNISGTILPNADWATLIPRSDLAGLRASDWDEVRVPVAAPPFSPDSLQRCDDMLAAYSGRAINTYSTISDGPLRCATIVRDLTQGKPLLVAPVLVSGPFGYDVVDGNHRLAAVRSMSLDQSNQLGLVRCWVGHWPNSKRPEA